MDKNTRSLIIIGSILTFIIIPVSAWIILSQTNKTPKGDAPSTAVTELKDRSNDELLTAMKEQSGELKDINFTITTVKRPQKGWYVITIESDGNPGRMLLQDTNNGLAVLLGPGTFFDTDATDPVGVPDAVVEELNK